MNTKLPLIMAAITILGMIIGGSMGYASLKDTVATTSTQVEKHDARISTVEKAVTEQTVMLKYIDKDLDENEKKQETIIEMLDNLLKK